MRILLIGKYPPCQGGVATRYYWLYKNLSIRFNWSFEVVTMLKSPYITPDMVKTKGVSVCPIFAQDSSSPWFIPHVDLAVERLVSAALDLCKVNKPDLIECNYLAPYGVAAATVAAILKCPLIIRPAGSDIGKLLNWKATQSCLYALFQISKGIMLPEDRIKSFKTYFNNHRNIISTPRYAPDPVAFNFISPLPKKTILVIGKINYHWRLKALDTLIEAIKDMPEWHLNCIVDGLHTEDFQSLLSNQLSQSQYTYNSFVSPEQVPSLIKKTWGVWNVLRTGGVSDFPNLHWETLASGRYSFISPLLFNHNDMSSARKNPLSINLDPDNPSDFKKQCNSLPYSSTYSLIPEFEQQFQNYISFHKSIYEDLI